MHSLGGMEAQAYVEQEQRLGSLSEYEHEVFKRAAELGLDTGDQVSWARFYWIAEEFYKAPLPEPWSAYADDEGQIFYYDHKSGESVWSHPLLQTFRNLYLKCQEEPYLHHYYRDLFNNLRQYNDQKKGWWALNLLASPNTGPPPTPEEVVDMASYLGISVLKEHELMWVAKQAVQVALPPNWEELEDEEGNVYFYDKATGNSSVKHPMDDYFFALVQEERRKAKKRKAKGEVVDPETSLRQLWMPFVDEATGETYYYNFRKNARLEFPPWENHYQAAAAIIQRNYRQHRGDHHVRTQAAITIQRIYRGYVVRDAVNAWKRECAALCIQTIWRMYYANKNFYKVLAAIHIQRAWRSHAARRGVRRAIAARKIQRVTRIFLARRSLAKLRDERNAAITLQAVLRGRKGRREARRRRHQRVVAARVEAEIEASVTLQAVQRGRVDRRRVAAMKLERDQRSAATTIQTMWRGRVARRMANGLREHNAAVTLQKTFRMRQARAKYRLIRAVVRSQALVRGKQAKQRVEFMKKHKEANFHKSATTIQAAWRGYHYRRTQKATAAAVKIQAIWKGHHYRTHTRQHNAALAIQSAWRGAVVRRVYRDEKRSWDLIALRLQFLYRRFIARRHKVIARMMAEYRVDCARLIQSTWRTHRERQKFLQYLHNREAMITLATRTQAVWKGYKARKRYNLMRDKDAWAAHNAVIIQTAWRAHAARSELVNRRDRRVEQREILNDLRPFFIEMYNLPEKVVRPSGHKLLDKLIMQEVCKEMTDLDLLGEEAVAALHRKVRSLMEEKAARQKTLDHMHHTLAIHWRLMQLPEERWLELPPAGAPGWVSNKVVKKCRAELERVKKLRKQAIEPLAHAAWADLQRIRDELGMTDKWRKKLKFYSPADEELVDDIVEQLCVLEDLYMPLAPLVPLVQHLEAHLQTQDDMLAATDPVMAAAAKQKALKRLARHESKIAEMHAEFPSLVSETLERLHQLERLALPVPVETVHAMFGIPTEEDLASDMERFMQTQKGKGSSEAVLRSIHHYRRVKKMAADAKAATKKKKKKRRDGGGEGVGGGRGRRWSGAKRLPRQVRIPSASQR